MNTKLMISLLLCTLFAAAVNSTIVEEDVLSEQMELFADPVDQKACFTYYREKSNQITDTYETELEKCYMQSQDAKDVQAKLNEEKRANLTNSGKQVNENLEKCQSIEDALEFFNCLTAASASCSETLYRDSLDSSSTSKAITMKYQEIENTKSTCNSTASNTYSQDLYANDKDMQGCIKGESTPPTKEVTTETTESTTVEPVTEEITEPTEKTDEPTEDTDEPTKVTDKPTEDTESPPDQPEVDTDEPERSPEEDIGYRMSKNAQARRYILKNLLH